MPKRPAWFVAHDPDAAPYAFFLSHVGEDSAEVQQLASAIHTYSGRGGRVPLACFLDVNNWPSGNVSSSVIKKFLRQSAHMAAWISPAYLQSTRGWVWMELAWAELIEQSMNVGQTELQHPYIVPVFRNVTVSQLERLPWLSYWQRQLGIPNQEQPLAEIAQRLVDFHDQEARKRTVGRE